MLPLTIKSNLDKFSKDLPFQVTPHFFIKVDLNDLAGKDEQNKGNSLGFFG
jgi:hypothetical protein